MLRQLSAALPGLAATTQPGLWQRRAAPLLLGEAFVSAAGKPVPVPARQDAADAAAAGRALVQLLDDPRLLISSAHCSPQRSFNLLAAMALWAGCALIPVSCTMRFSSLPPAASPGTNRRAHLPR